MMTKRAGGVVTVKIKNKLILFAFLTSILPLIGLALIAFESSSSTINRLVGAELTTVSSEKLEQIESFFGDAAVDIETWSRLLIMQDVLTDDEEGELGSELKRLLEQYSYFADLLVINDSGKVIAGKKELTEEGVHAAVSKLLTDAVLKGKRYQGRVQLLGADKAPVLIMAAPIRADYDAETMIGGLIGIIDWTQIQKRLEQVPIAGVAQDSDHRLILTSGSDLLFATGSGIGGLSGVAPVTLPTQAGIAEVSSEDASFLIGTADAKGGGAFSNPGWRLHVLLSIEVAYESVAALGQRFLAVGVFVLLLGGVAGGFLARSIISPIRNASYRMHDIAQGDGDLTEYLDDQGRDETSQMAGSFNVFLQKLKQIIVDIIDSSRQMNQSAFQVAAISDEIANIDRDQMADSKEVSSAADELLQIAQSVQALAEEAREAVAATDKESQAGHAKVEANISEMQRTVTEVDQAARDIAELSDESQRIHAIIETINTIAEQTNLLALNAAIEAARAGEQGRGFAVVADEVRNLASRTAESTVEITAIVNDLTGKVDGTVEVMEGLVERAGVSMTRAQETAQAFDAISGGVQTANGVSHRITDAAGSQMEQLETMRAKLQKLFATLEHSTDKAHTTSLVSNDLYQISERINSMLKRFNVGDSADHEFYREPNEKRQSPRLEAFLLVGVKQGTLEIDGVTRDISIGGMQLEVEEPLDKSALLDIGLFIPKKHLKEFASQNPLNLSARIVRHFNEGGVHKYGIEFENIDDLKRNGIEKVFEFFHSDAYYAS